MFRFIPFLCFCFLAVLTSSFASQIENEIIEDSENNLIYSATETYTILKKMGEGVFGEVFAVKDSKDRRFALKSYKKNPTLPIYFYTDADREFMRGQLLDHPYIIKSLDLFVFEPAPDVFTNNLILEFVDGETLAATPQDVFSSQKAVEEALHLCHALRYALSQGFMHLDLHRGNVMLNHELEIRVIDLASFFTFEELIQGYYDYEAKKQQNDEALAAQGSSSSQAKGLAIARKLRDIFEENPELIEALKKADQIAQRLNQDEQNAVHLTRKTAPYDHYLASVSQYYFKKISAICKSLFDKSDLLEEEKTNLNARIDAFASEYENDLQAGVAPSLEHYLEQLTDFLNQLSFEEGFGFTGKDSSARM